MVRRIETPNVYHFFNHNIENIDHIFRECPFVQGIWDRIKYKCPTPLFYEGDFGGVCFFHLMLNITFLSLMLNST